MTVVGASAADPPAARELGYIDVAERLMGTARALTDSVQAAEDLVFDTMASLVPHWDSIRASPVGYARRSMVNRFRDQGRHKQVVQAYQHSLVTLTPRIQESAADAVNQKLDIAEALSQLPKRTQQVIVLRYQMDITSKAVALILGIPAGSVRRIGLDGLRQLSVLLTTSDSEERK